MPAGPHWPFAANLTANGAERPPALRFCHGNWPGTGRAVAGKIGTLEQVKVTVFGPVVKLASRLEGLTKQLRVPILLDDATAQLIRQRLPPEIRAAAQAGSCVALCMIDLWSSMSCYLEKRIIHSFLTARFRLRTRGRKVYRRGLGGAYRCLHSMPSSDRAQDFLIHQIAMNNRQPPKGWDGTVRFPEM